jgi:gluconokinase
VNMRIVAVDVGSSSVRAVAFDEDGVAEPGDAHAAYDEPDADVLVAACRAVLSQVGEGDLVAISAFWHSLVALDARGRPLTPVLTWREPQHGRAPKLLDPAEYHRRTGCFVHPSYWPAKIARLTEDGVSVAHYVSFGDYLLRDLTGELAASVSTASGTGLFDPNRLDWDDDVLDGLGLTRGQLPPIADEPVHGVFPALGDGACSNVGAGCATRDRAALMIGTSGALRVVYEADRVEPRDGLFLYRLDRRRFCEGGALSDGGNLWAWLQRTLRDVDADELADRPAAAHGVTFLPFLGGERALGWDADRRGLVAGLSFATTPLDLAQAALEGVAYRFADVLDALGAVEEVVVTGGAVRANPAWTQILADVLGRPLHVSAAAEASARGAAIAALGRLDLGAPVDHVVEPRLDRTAIHAQAREVHRVAMRWKETA